MSLKELLELVPPPPHVSETTEAMPWKDIETALGTRLPIDYLEFGRHYGHGDFGDDSFSFNVINPLSANYLHSLREKLKLERTMREAFPHVYPVAIFPVFPGLLPWGQDVDGGTMAWLRGVEDPNDWSVVTRHRDDKWFERFDMPFTTFLCKSLQHELRPRIWRPDFPKDLGKVVFCSGGRMRIGPAMLDKETHAVLFEISWWQWHAIVGVVESLGVLPSHRVQALRQWNEGELTRSEAQAVAEALRSRVLPTLRENERLLANGQKTSQREGEAYSVSLEDLSQQENNFYTDGHALLTFVVACEACNGFEVG